MKKPPTLDISVMSKQTREVFADVAKNNFILSDSNSFESMCDLAYLLYIDNKLEEAKDICDEFSSYKFQGNYDFWIWVRYALALRSRIARTKGSEVENAFFKHQVLAALESGDEDTVHGNRKVHARYLNGNKIDFGKVQLAIDKGDKVSELGWRLVYLKNQISLEQFGSTNVDLAEKITSEIEDNLQLIKKLNTAA
jgi:hypothetical protein